MIIIQKTSRSFWQYCKELPVVDNNNNASGDFAENDLTDSFNFKVKLTGQTGNDETKNVEMNAPLKYLSNFWRILEMSIINCDISLILAWSANGVIVSTNVVNQNVTFSINLYKIICPSSNFINTR